MRRMRRITAVMMAVILTGGLCVFPGNTCVVRAEDIEEGIPEEPQEHVCVWNEGEVKKPATCTEAGIKEYTCEECGEKMSEEIPALGHEPSGEWITEKASTLTEDGCKYRICDRCEEKCDETPIYHPDKITLSTTSYTYTGKKRTPTVKVVDSVGMEIPAEGNYDVSYSSSKRTSIGRYKVTVTFKGDYSEKKELYFTIGPVNTSLVTAKLYGHDDVKVSWKKVNGASGYEVYYKKSTDSSYTYLKSTTALSCKKSNLADGKKYIFKVVAYKKVNGYVCCNAGRTGSVYTLKKVSDPKMVRSGSKIKVKWTNISGESGYQISKSKSKTGTCIAATYKTTTGTSKTIYVPQGKNYYYKVRAYRTVDGKKIYGPWSNAVWYKKYPPISYSVTPMHKIYYQDCGLVSMTMCELYFEEQGKGAYKDLIKKETTVKNKVKALYKKNGGVLCRWNIINYNKVCTGHYDDIYTALEKGPVIVHKTSSHYSVVYAYTGSKTTLQAKGFKMIEVFNGKETNLAAWLSGGINGRGRLDQVIGRK